MFVIQSAKWPTAVPFLRDHALAITLLGTLAAVRNLWRARDWRRIRGLELTLIDQTNATAPTTPGTWLGQFAQRNTDHALGIRRRSLKDWVRAVQLESPGISHTKGLALAGLVLVLACPLFEGSGGYPLAWYRLVFRWSDGTGPLLSVLLWIGLIAAGLAAPMPRRDMLYPIPRRMRAAVAFWSTAGCWLIMFIVWVGSALLLAVLAGWWLKLPMPAGAIVRLIAPATLSFSVLPILRLVALHCEGRSETTLWATVIITVPLTIIGWIGLSQVPPMIAAAVAVTAAGLGLAGYYALLRDYFTGEDLIQPLPAKPSFRVM